MFNRRFFEFERHSRLFEKGDLKYIILDLIKDKPSHGYEVIRALGERFHGFYSPSAGSVYPTLQLLQDLGYVSVSEQDGKKTYTIIEEGKRFLKEREETIDKIKGHMRDWWGIGKRAEFQETMREFRDLALLLGRKSHRLNPDKLAKIKEIISRAHHDIENIIEQAN